MNKNIDEFTELKDIKFYVREVKKNNKSYIDTLIVFPNGKDFYLIPNYHLYNRITLCVYKHNILKMLKS